ncbi:hypothetical protein RRG08_064962, partial [Elysia crispata]
FMKWRGVLCTSNSQSAACGREQQYSSLFSCQFASSPVFAHTTVTSGMSRPVFTQLSFVRLWTLSGGGSSMMVGVSST